MKLSICIPTYNFGKFIGETLDSVIPQLTNDVEVVILDGASTDNTTEIVRNYQKRCPQISYFRQRERGGIDKDMHLSVEKARGDYCWLFSSDDVMEKGSIARMLEEIREGMDLYLCNYTICELDARTVLRAPDILNLSEPTSFDLSLFKERKRYFELAIATPAFFSFMSAIVIKRSRWLETAIDPSFFGSCWAHVARIFSMIPSGLRVKYLPSNFLRLRSFNDSFLDKGYIQRVAIAIDGYHKIADAIFGYETFEAFHIRRAIRREFRIRLFLHAKQEIKTHEDRKKVFDLIEKTFVDLRGRRLACILMVSLFPRRAIALLRYLYQKGQVLNQKWRQHG